MLRHYSLNTSPKTHQEHTSYSRTKSCRFMIQLFTENIGEKGDKAYRNPANCPDNKQAFPENTNGKRK